MNLTAHLADREPRSRVETVARLHLQHMQAIDHRLPVQEITELAHIRDHTAAELGVTATYAELSRIARKIERRQRS